MVAGVLWCRECLCAHSSLYDSCVRVYYCNDWWWGWLLPCLREIGTSWYKLIERHHFQELAARWRCDRHQGKMYWTISQLGVPGTWWCVEMTVDVVLGVRVPLWTQFWRIWRFSALCCNHAIVSWPRDGIMFWRSSMSALTDGDMIQITHLSHLETSE